MLFFTHKSAASTKKCRSQQKTFDRSRWEFIINKETEDFFLLIELLHSLLINSGCEDLLMASSYSSLIQEIEIGEEKEMWRSGKAYWCIKMWIVFTKIWSLNCWWNNSLFSTLNLPVYEINFSNRLFFSLQMVSIFTSHTRYEWHTKLFRNSQNHLFMRKTAFSKLAQMDATEDQQIVSS